MYLLDRNTYHFFIKMYIHLLSTYVNGSKHSWPFNRVPHVVVTLKQQQQQKSFLLLLHNYNFSTVMNHRVNIGYASSVKGLFHGTRVEVHWPECVALARALPSLFRRRGIRHCFSHSHNSMLLALYQSLWQRWFNLLFSPTQLDSATHS